jgi:hypothetical protein
MLTTNALRKAFQEITQKLVPAGAVVAVTGLAEQGAHFRPGDRAFDTLHDGMHIIGLSISELYHWPGLLAHTGDQRS